MGRHESGDPGSGPLKIHGPDRVRIISTGRHADYPAIDEDILDGPDRRRWPVPLVVLLVIAVIGLTMIAGSKMVGSDSGEGPADKIPASPTTIYEPSSESAADPTSKAAAPTVTKRVPGPVVTVPSPVPGPTVKVPVPGPTVTKTVTAPAETVTKTKEVPAPAKTKTVTAPAVTETVTICLSVVLVEIPCPGE
jgi:hypothetical protein